MANSSPTTERLVEECQGLVRFLARQIHTRTSARLDLDDLIGYGQVGLMQAAREFDPEKGTKFSTFAYYRIRGAIYDGVNKLQWFRAARHPEIKSGPLIDALLEETNTDNPPGQSGASNQSIADAGWFSRVASSLAVIFLASSDDQARSADVADESASDPSDGMVQQETRAKLREAISSLPTEVAAVVRAVYFEDRTLKEAADQMGISKSWASRLHSRALEQLARQLKEIAF
jgi:RNA polymerase sigma factor for flagellar operon FliA